MGRYRLAQYNVATLKAPLNAPESAEFRNALDHINTLGEAQPGFIWRAVGEGFDSATPAADQDPLYIVNLTVWESAEALAAFAYRTEHRLYVRHREKWFQTRRGPSYVLWWIPVDHTPSDLEGEERLAELTANGPSERAFDFANRFPPPLVKTPKSI
ncbi:MAG: hypothetical protein CGW95_03175 [Phenylobacterium zucineum]|nr:MAG: hypothetical protein CGW95_03175 [Phenylobacterium zucineum]